MPLSSRKKLRNGAKGLKKVFTSMTLGKSLFKKISVIIGRS